MQIGTIAYRESGSEKFKTTQPLNKDIDEQKIENYIFQNLFKILSNAVTEDRKEQKK